MKRISRRSFSKLAAASAAGCAFPLVAQMVSPVEITLEIGPESKGPVMPPHFTGLSYEGAQLADPTFFSAKNTGLIKEFRKLGTNGQLRLGGCLSDFTAWWDPAVTPTRPAMTPAIAAGQKRFEWIMTTPSVSRDKYAVITPESISELRGFCDATGWTVAYGLNLGLGTPERAGAEGACVVRELGPKLEAFQVGNEADYFMHWKRPPTWNFDDYWREYTSFEQAVRAHAPQAPFAGPDAAFVAWLQLYAERAGRDPRFLSSHYYHMGPAGAPGIDAEKLLTPNPKLQQRIDAATQATAVAGVPYRMTEVNSCSHGGQPGVSDAFVSALWVADLMLTLAQSGVSGVNLHGGGIEGVYSPIVGDQQTGYTSRPLTYGMRFAGEFANASFAPVTVDMRGVNASVFAAHRNNEVLVAVVNKSSTPLRCKLKGIGRAAGRLVTLTGPTLTSTTGTALQEDRHVGDRMDIPRYSAMLLVSRV